jgi:hypothetical protein
MYIYIYEKKYHYIQTHPFIEISFYTFESIYTNRPPIFTFLYRLHDKHSYSNYIKRFANKILRLDEETFKIDQNDDFGEVTVFYKLRCNYGFGVIKCFQKIFSVLFF